MAGVRIYQLFLRLFGNESERNLTAGSRAENGAGGFAEVSDEAAAYVADLGFTHVWLMGVLRHATREHYPGMPADPAPIVKGLAGSPFAIKDYHDVHPGLAREPSRRLEEFAAMLARLRARGLRPIVDFVPNHVSRAYDSAARPATSLGRGDDRGAFFAPQNDFFYLVDPPGRALRITPPEHWPEGAGGFAPEDGSPGRPPRVTGNNVTEVEVGPSDWYDTIKLNYGFNFADGTCRYDPVPPLWGKMDEVLAFWQSLGVKGFRCDFAHWVPVEFWRHALGRARARDPEVFFLAEAYSDPDGSALAGSPPGTTLRSLVAEGGFDAVYDHEAFRRSRLLAAGLFDARRLDSPAEAALPAGRGARYAENHDERRAASALFAGREPGETGYGSGRAGFAAAASLFLSASGPLLVYAGQEVGERGEGDKGYSRDDGRSSLFDYWSPPALRALTGAGYDVARLPPEMAALLRDYAALLRLLATHPSLAPLARLRTLEASGDAGRHVHAFLRSAEGAPPLLVMVNLHPERALGAEVRVPADLRRELCPGDTLVTRQLLGPGGFTLISARKLEAPGLTVALPPHHVSVLSLEKPS